MNLLVTGAYGFIGANFAHYVTGLGHNVVAYDAMTYAANPRSLDLIPATKLISVVGDIRDSGALTSVFARGFHDAPFDAVVNFAAESHVDRSISLALPFVETNVLGAVTLLEATRTARVRTFIQISTDEVYGSIEGSEKFNIGDSLAPSSAYSASKAAADLLVLSYHKTHEYDVRITRCTNNYGPFQHLEKFIPTVITSALGGKPIPIYGDGEQVRDWIHVNDHCAGILRVIESGRAGEVYHFGGPEFAANPIGISNLNLASNILSALAKCTGVDVAQYESLIQHVTDRLGHDRRYALDWSDSERSLGWRPTVELSDGLEETVRWFLANKGSGSGVEPKA